MSSSANPQRQEKRRHMQLGIHLRRAHRRSPHRGPCRQASACLTWSRRCRAPGRFAPLDDLDREAGRRAGHVSAALPLGVHLQVAPAVRAAARDGTPARGKRLHSGVAILMPASADVGAPSPQPVRRAARMSAWPTVHGGAPRSGCDSRRAAPASASLRSPPGASSKPGTYVLATSALNSAGQKSNVAKIEFWVLSG